MTKHPFSVNKGHGGNTPNLPVIRPLDPVQYRHVTARLEPGTKAYKMGKLRILVSPPIPGIQGWHMSISHPDRYPTWDEIAKARYELCPLDIEMVMYLPPPTEYVNVHNYCFHLHELVETKP